VRLGQIRDRDLVDQDDKFRQLSGEQAAQRRPPRLRREHDWKDNDDRRPSFAGEHWIVLAAGLALIAWSARRRSPLTAAIGRTPGLGLVTRAASGRDGVRRLARGLR
jgi:hypothetical protein